MFSEEHLHTGHIPLNSPSKNRETPVISIHIAVVTNQKRTFHHHLEVIGYALEQLEYLKSSSESNCYFDLKVNGIEPSLTAARHEVTQNHKEDSRAVQGVLTWLDFFHKELELPINRIKDSLLSLKSYQPNRLSQEHWNNIDTLEDSCAHLKRTMEVMANLTKPGGLQTNTVFDEVDIRHTLNWILKQVQPIAEEKKVKLNIKVENDISHILIDKKGLIQSLLYIIRNAIRSSPSESRIDINLKDKNEEYIHLEINSSNQYLPPRVIYALTHGQTDASQPETGLNELFPAGVLLRGLGGKIEVNSSRASGTVHRIALPKKWQSLIAEVNTLQVAMDISRKEAREIIKNIQHHVVSNLQQVPAEFEDTYEKLGNKVQELAVLCNRSLFLADNFRSRLELQQDRLLHQESEQSATLEAILNICRDNTRSVHETLFDTESSKRVVRYALAIANELKISDAERHAIYRAALLKDISLAFSRAEIIESMVSSIEKAASLKQNLNRIWRSLSNIPFLLPACNILLYKFEKYDGSGGNFGVKGTDIPLGSRILAVADAYDSMTSDRSPQGLLTEPKSAVKQIASESGLSFDPNVVDALQMIWKKYEPSLVSSELY
jgi:HD-GYP domain-containing protein (c-di-GMP phosphodiesterase class II)